ncbi:MAG: homoserine O-acetyltransferase [Bacteroidia bacterium]
MSKNYFFSEENFLLESGEILPQLEITYHTYGTLNADKSNVVWICHALTANSDAADWWHILVGEKKIFDPEKYFIVCANILGSCYGSSGPLSIDPKTEKKFFSAFPRITIRDMIQAHIVLRKKLGIEKIHALIGGSMGGYQAMEWMFTESLIFENCILIATSAKESAWGIAIHTAQRMAIETDTTWKNNSENAGKQGLKTARAIGMLTYRNYEAYVKMQTDESENHDALKASSYILYQGEKLANRFNTYSYWLLTKGMDSHNLARGRGKMKTVLNTLKTKTLVIGISEDLLCPVAEQKFLAKHLANATYQEIHSLYGHDGFLIEESSLTEVIRDFLK